MENRTRQLWAEKNLEIAPSRDEQAWTERYDFLHDKVEEPFKAVLPPDAVDLRPATPQEAYTQSYQERLRREFRNPGYKIGARFVHENVCVRVPLTKCEGNPRRLTFYLLGISPTDPRSKDSGKIEDFLHTKAGCVAAAMDGYQVLPPRVFSPTLSSNTLSPIESEDSVSLMVCIGRDEGSKRIVEELNGCLGDPFNAPANGRFFAPLDLALLSSKDRPRYLVANKTHPIAKPTRAQPDA